MAEGLDTVPSVVGKEVVHDAATIDTVDYSEPEEFLTEGEGVAGRR